MGSAPPPETLDAQLFSLPASGRLLAAASPSKKLFARVRRWRFAPDGFGGVSLPITVLPSQGIGSCGIKGERP
jgi:hypothetical protein